MIPIILNKNDTAKDIKIRYQEIDYKNYNIILMYDKQYNLFGVLIDGKHDYEILANILKKYVQDEISLYLDTDEENINYELLEFIYRQLFD